MKSDIKKVNEEEEIVMLKNIKIEEEKNKNSESNENHENVVEGYKTSIVDRIVKIKS